MWEPRASVEPERAPVTREPEPPPPPPAPEFVELVVPSDAVLGLQIERTVTSEVARVEDRVDARVTRDVRVGDRVAIPAGSLVQGSVMEVERGGKVREKAKLGIRFHTVVLADGTRLNIKTDSVLREGTSPTNESAAKIGGAAAGGFWAPSSAVARVRFWVAPLARPAARRRRWRARPTRRCWRPDRRSACGCSSRSLSRSRSKQTSLSGIRVQGSGFRRDQVDP
jgi:hypothetical protein